MGRSAKAEWNKRYKLARNYLYGSERIPQDFAEAMHLFSLEADSGNALAMYDLGRMCADGLGVEADPDMAQEWYRKALAAFMYAEKELPERKKTYLQYRIGKMYLAGLGCTQDYKTAADWLERAAGKQHKYAQYSLAGLYARGQGVEKDLEHAKPSGEELGEIFRGHIAEDALILTDGLRSYNIFETLANCTVVDAVLTLKFISRPLTRKGISFPSLLSLASLKSDHKIPLDRF